MAQGEIVYVTSGATPVVEGVDAQEPGAMGRAPLDLHKGEIVALPNLRFSVLRVPPAADCATEKALNG